MKLPFTHPSFFPPLTAGYQVLTRFPAESLSATGSLKSQNLLNPTLHGPYPQEANNLIKR